MASLVLLLGVVLLGLLVRRQASSAAPLRLLTTVALVAVLTRVAAVTVVYFLAIRTHGEGTWLNDEASFYLATESLLANPLDRNLPYGLDHLAGNGYLGLTTFMAVVLGRMDTVAFRLFNAVLGSFMAVIAALLAGRLLGRRAALLSGLVVGLWPTLVLWSATMLRDTLVGFSVLAVVWLVGAEQRVMSLRVVCVWVLALVLLAGLRPYLAAAVGLGLAAWLVFPLLARLSRPRLVLVGAASAVIVVGTGVIQARRIDQVAHELLFRQTATRIETQGRLYHQRNPASPPPEPPFGPNAPVALIDPNTGWLLTGVVQEPLGSGTVSVAFVDDTVRSERIANLVLLQSAPLSPAQMLASLGPGLVGFATGVSGTGDQSSPAWTADALMWDVLLALGVLGGLRARIPSREWLLPACVVLGTAAALIVVPGAPGNDDRHRATQTLPLLMVFASGLLARRQATASLRTSRGVGARIWRAAR